MTAAARALDEPLPPPATYSAQTSISSSAEDLMRRTLLIAAGWLWLLTVPAGAMADGGPATVSLGGSGVTVTGDPYNYVAMPVGDSTVVERVGRTPLAVDGGTILAGAFGVPTAATDATTTGLSADGRTLVLADTMNSYGIRTSTLLVLGTGSLQVRERVRLPGFYAVDAVSPTGRWLYLTHYRSRLIYEVRVYDLVKRRLLPRPLVDPREPGEKMVGVPVTRTVSADGRWTYTLYDRGTRTPFVHALDTAGRRAFCIELPALRGVDTYSLRLMLTTGGSLSVERAGMPLALIETHTLAASSGPFSLAESSLPPS
jgi:hypothetical protein